MLSTPDKGIRRNSIDIGIHRLYKHRPHHYNAPSLRGTGGIAQLGERLHGMQEVSGSIPLISTKEHNESQSPHRLEA